MPDGGPLELLDAELTQTDTGAAIAFDLVPRLMNPLGNLHGGLLLCASEVAGSAALRSGGLPFVTSTIHISFLRPAPLGQRLTVEAVVEHRGRSLGLATVTTRNAAGRVCTIATITAHAVG